MKPAGAPTLFVIDDNAVVRAAVQGVRDAAMHSMIGRFCNRLLIEDVRVRRGHAKGIANHALRVNQSRVTG
jgi:hypothetical protein